MVLWTFYDGDNSNSIIEKIYKENRAAMIKYAKKHLGDFASEAEDAVQNTFLSIMKYKKSFPKKENQAIAYITTCLRHEIFKIRSATIKFYSLLDCFGMEALPVIKSTEEASVNSIILSDIMNFIYSLSERECFIFLMRVVHKAKVNDIAKYEEISKNTVFSTVKSVRQKINERFGADI